MSKRQQTAHESHSKLSQPTFRATGQALEYRTEFGYDDLGEVTSGKKYWSDNTEVGGQQFEYAFDTIGNRTSTSVNGHSAAYHANLLNQYTDRDVPPYIPILGTARSNATVSIWTSGAEASTVRKGPYFFGELYLPGNSSSPLWLSITNYAVLMNTPSPDIVVSNVGSAFLPQTAEQFGYDADGNLRWDGRWSYAWDGENRLVQVTSRTMAGPAQNIKFDYDWQGRRIRKRVWNNLAGEGNPVLEQRFIYDGWNLIATINAQLAPVNSFVWGLDLSGSEQGAGGVGGLVAFTDSATASTHFPSYDGNGNVCGLASAPDGSTTALYEYGPFGEVVRATGTMAKVYPFRFSTKYQDDETDLVYYGYRFYSASSGGWLSRDPIFESGGVNLYSFVRNNPLIGSDALGKLSVIYTGEGMRMPVDIDPSVSVYDPCHGGPLVFTIKFEAQYTDNGEDNMHRWGVWFAFDGSPVSIYDFTDAPMRWQVGSARPLAYCPHGKQSGSIDFGTGDSTYGLHLAIILDYHYECDCHCNLIGSFKTSLSYFVYPPLEPPPHRKPLPIIMKGGYL